MSQLKVPLQIRRVLKTSLPLAARPRELVIVEGPDGPELYVGTGTGCVPFRLDLAENGFNAAPGGVTSFAGRTGAVDPLPLDYGVADIAGLPEALEAAQLPAWFAAHPDRPPQVPHPWSDEFSGPSLDPAWTWTNAAGGTASLVAPQGLLLQAPVEGFGAVNFRVLSKAITAPFDAFTRLELYHNVTRYNQLGLAALSSSGAMVVMRMLGNDGPVIWDTARFYSPTAYQGQVATGLTRPSPVAYVRMAFDGTTLRLYWSHDGRFWWQQVASGEPVGAGQFLTDIAGIGLVWNSANTVWPVAGYVPFLRRTQ